METMGLRDERGMAEMTRGHPSGHVPESLRTVMKRESGGGKRWKRKVCGMRGI